MGVCHQGIDKSKPHVGIFFTSRVNYKKRKNNSLRSLVLRGEPFNLSTELTSLGENLLF